MAVCSIFLCSHSHVADVNISVFFQPVYGICSFEHLVEEDLVLPPMFNHINDLRCFQLE
jgi:hypothetical protein